MQHGADSAKSSDQEGPGVHADLRDKPGAQRAGQHNAVQPAGAGPRLHLHVLSSQGRRE